MTKVHRMRVRTDTATLAVFDPERLRHRLADSCDWWSVPEDEVQEINAGNLFTVALGSDGVYQVTVHLYDERPDLPALSGLIRCDSGEVFIGAGEQIPGDGLEPDLSFGGLSLGAAVGSYRVWVGRRDTFEIDVWLEGTEAEAHNAFSHSPRLED
jgi:hypothetical protein